MKQKRIILSAVKFISVFLAFFISTPVVVFGTYLNLYGKIACDSQNGADTYRLYDTVIDPDEFSEFLRDQQAIQRVFRFYEELENSEQVQFSTVSSQPIVVHDLKCTDESVRLEDMGVNEGDTLVKALQLNQNAMRKNPVEFSEGGMDWEAVKWSNRSTPVFLGASYRPWYAVGDEILAEFYNEAFRFVVAGFFADESQVIFRNEAFDLKDYIVVPYPPKIQELDCTDRLKGMLAFAMIRGDIAVEHSEDSMHRIWNEIESIAEETGFAQVGIEGVTKYILAYDGVNRFFNGKAAIYALAFSLLLFLTAFGCVFLEAGQTVKNVSEYARKGIFSNNFLFDLALYLSSMMVSCILLGVLYEIKWRALIEVTVSAGAIAIALLIIGKQVCIRCLSKRTVGAGGGKAGNLDSQQNDKK